MEAARQGLDGAAVFSKLRGQPSRSSSTAQRQRLTGTPAAWTLELHCNRSFRANVASWAMRALRSSETQTREPSAIERTRTPPFCGGAGFSYGLGARWSATPEKRPSPSTISTSPTALASRCGVRFRHGGATRLRRLDRPAGRRARQARRARGGSPCGNRCAPEDGGARIDSCARRVPRDRLELQPRRL